MLGGWGLGEGWVGGGLVGRVATVSGGGDKECRSHAANTQYTQYVIDD